MGAGVAGVAGAVTLAAWIRDKGMQVLSLYDPRNPLLEVDLFVESPIPFADLWARAESVPLASTTVRVASIRDLVTMKRLAGRRQDLEDIEALEEIERVRGGGDG